MRFFARWIKRPFDVTVQCSQPANACHHDRAVELDYQEQGFDRGLPLLMHLLGLGELLDVFGGVPQGNELTAVVPTVGEPSRRRLWTA